MSSRAGRFVVATNWQRPGHIVAALRAYAPLGRPPAPVSFVLAVPHEPTEDDAQRMRLILGRIPVPISGAIEIESFSEVLSKPHEAALVPQGSPEATLVLLSDWITRLALIEVSRRAGDLNSGSLEDLRHALTNFDESPLVPTSAAAPSGPSWHGTYVGGGRVLARLTTGGRVYLPADNRATTPNVMQSGVFEPELHAYISQNVPTGGVAVDVGANIGILTVALARAVGLPGRVIALEPVPSNLEYVRWNIETNWLMDIVTVVPAAASDTEGTTAMQVSDEWNSLGSISQTSLHLTPGREATAQHSIEVPTVRLDDLFAEEERLDLVKIDVEGAEPLVFSGMSGLLKRGVVERVAFECMREHVGDSWGSFMDALAELERQGWTFGVPRADGQVAVLPAAALRASGTFRCVVMERPGLRTQPTAHRM